MYACILDFSDILCINLDSLRRGSQDGHRSLVSINLALSLAQNNFKKCKTMTNYSIESYINTLSDLTIA